MADRNNLPKNKKSWEGKIIEKFTTYHPDILVPEISSAVEYKYLRKGENPATFINQLKTDADSYAGDPEYRFFYAVVYYEDKSAINQGAFKAAIDEKGFPENWDIIAL